MLFGLIAYVAPATHLATWEKIAVFFGVGVVTGTVGINYSHELMHQKSKVERWLAELWGESLELDQIGLDDRYFELGGTSLQAARLVANIQQELSVSIFVVSLFSALALLFWYILQIFMSRR